MPPARAMPISAASECSAARLAHLSGGQGVVGSNPATPTTHPSVCRLKARPGALRRERFGAPSADELSRRRRIVVLPSLDPPRLAGHFGGECAGFAQGSERSADATRRDRSLRSPTVWRNARNAAWRSSCATERKRNASSTRRHRREPTRMCTSRRLRWISRPAATRRSRIGAGGCADPSQFGRRFSRPARLAATQQSRGGPIRDSHNVYYGT